MTTPEELTARGLVRACRIDEVPQMLARKVLDHILICRDGEDFYAVDLYCPHKDEPMDYALVHEGTITCPHHQYAFDLDTGRAHRRRCEALRTYELVRLGDELWVEDTSQR